MKSSADRVHSLGCRPRLEPLDRVGALCRRREHCSERNLPGPEQLPYSCPERCALRREKPVGNSLFSMPTRRSASEMVLVNRCTRTPRTLSVPLCSPYVVTVHDLGAVLANASGSVVAAGAAVPQEDGSEFGSFVGRLGCAGSTFTDIPATISTFHRRIFACDESVSSLTNDPVQ